MISLKVKNKNYHVNIDERSSEIDLSYALKPFPCAAHGDFWLLQSENTI